MGVNRLTGVPWHKERVSRAEGDARRYKGRCLYYSYDKDYCSKRCGRCMGSAHCDWYSAISEEQFSKRQKENTVKSKKKKNAGEDDVFWY